MRRGDAKITFGTGGMLDVVLDETPPRHAQRNEHGTFPIVAWRHAGRCVWGVEAVMLAAGTNIQWLRDDLGIIATSDESHELAASCTDSGGVVFVPAPLGLGTPDWDYGARAALFGLTRGTGRAEIVRAVLEGIAHRGADLVDAAVADTDVTIPHVRVDGGMTDNPTFVQALADATQRPVEISPVREATGLGAALLAGIAVGHHASVDELATTWQPRATVEPAACPRPRPLARCGATLAPLDPGAVGNRFLSSASETDRCLGDGGIDLGGGALVGELAGRLDPEHRRGHTDQRGRTAPCRHAGAERHGQAVDGIGHRTRTHPFGILRVLFHRRDRADAEGNLARAEHPSHHPRRRRRGMASEHDAQHDAGHDQHRETHDDPATRDDEHIGAMIHSCMVPRGVPRTQLGYPGSSQLDHPIMGPIAGSAVSSSPSATS